MQNDISTAANSAGLITAATENDVVLTSQARCFSLATPNLDSRFAMQHQDLINRQALCMTRLREAAREVESLRLENAALRSVNSHLHDNLSSFLTASTTTPPTTPLDIASNFHNLCNIGGGVGEEEDESPTSVMEVQSVDPERTSLPKSISVRSNGYLKTTAAAGSSKSASATSRRVTRTRTASPLTPAQKVYVRGGKKEEEPVELEVYHQGMFKTELCNKWQETGDCPYGDHCQFAHGIQELRPVIRHPRYKTEVCRMVLAGDICPYGHRCHFRHALTEEERFMSHLKLRPVKLNR